MKIRNLLLMVCLVVLGLYTKAQNGLEGIYVERYYVADANDAAHSTPAVPVGAVTYRIYADLLPGYKVQSIYGSSVHSLLMNTTTYFYNCNYGGYGVSIPTNSANNTKKNAMMIDSWLTTGGACNGYLGVPKAEDNGVNNFVNSNNPQLLQNNAAQAVLPLTTQDGMIAGTVKSTTTLGLDALLPIFGDGSANGNSFLVTNGAWACLDGAVGPNPTTNKVLIAQITTNGVFHFELNIQIGTPTLGTQNYVHSNPGVGERTIPSLTQTLYPTTQTLNVTAFPEGLFNTGTGKLSKTQNVDDQGNQWDNFAGTVADTITVALAETTDPFNIVYISNGDSLTTDGKIALTDVPAELNGAYYVIVRHRNSVETWSQVQQFAGSTVNYDFTTSDSKAYGNNLKQVGSAFCLFSGDVSGDQYIDVVDVGLVFNDNLDGAYGYRPSDVNGDGYVDVVDVGIVFNNNLIGAGLISPATSMKKLHGGKTK